MHILIGRARHGKILQRRWAACLSAGVLRRLVMGGWGYDLRDGGIGGNWTLGEVGKLAFRWHILAREVVVLTLQRQELVFLGSSLLAGDGALYARQDATGKPCDLSQSPPPILRFRAEVEATSSLKSRVTRLLWSLTLRHLGRSPLHFVLCIWHCWHAGVLVSERLTVHHDIPPGIWRAYLSARASVGCRLQ
jgi:hypothetical protein